MWSLTFRGDGGHGVEGATYKADREQRVADGLQACGKALHTALASLHTTAEVISATSALLQPEAARGQRSRSSDDARSQHPIGRAAEPAQQTELVSLLADVRTQLNRMEGRLQAIEGHGSPGGGGSSQVGARTGTSPASPPRQLQARSVYDQFVLSSDGGGQRDTMDELVRHMQASQARHELEHMRRGWWRLPERLELWLERMCVGPLFKALALLPRCKARRRFAWQAFHVLALVCCVVLVPLRLGFPSSFDDDDAWFTAELVVDLVFVVDTLTSAVTPYHREGKTLLVTDPRKILSHYAWSWGVFDVASSLPLAPLLYWSGGAPDPRAAPLVACRLLKILRFAKLLAVLREMRKSSVMSHALN
jgi:hypothetical protein